MQQLNQQNIREYLLKVYASWLGKVIGVRFGAPIENWTHEQIMEKYPVMDGYPVDYGNFAADDDTNGPLFFVRALEDYGRADADTIGKTFLNYICEYSGFFWWGGIGVSSEHTAYENLKNGIPGSSSGKIGYNGLTIAEQIGGQIFSDCWGYVSGCDPALAGKLASEAAKVTHDGNGIQGAIFVAVAIALAMQKNDIHEVLRESLEYLDKDMEYHRVAQDIITFYQNNADDWHKCLRYIFRHYGYDRYPGACHIIPNMALMVMAMCYGDNDFDRTMIILNSSGWDTDCNCGNVGSIMGALLGLEGIPEKWILPLNDTVNCSSCVGSLNLQTISGSAVMFTRLACKLKNIRMKEYPLFSLPYASKGILCKEGGIGVKDDMLHVGSKDIFRYVYYLPTNLYDARYDPQFSPVLYSGDRISIDIETQGNLDLETYATDCEGEECTERFLICERGTITIALPKGINRIINKVGIHSEGPYRISDIRIQRHPDQEFRFRNYPIDMLGPRYEGDFLSNIRAFVRHSGSWTIEDGLLGQSKEHALISSGSYGSRYDRIEWDFTPIQGKEHFLVCDMQGYMHYSAIGFMNEELVLLRKDDEISALYRHPYRWKHGIAYRMTLEQKNGETAVAVNDDSFVFPKIEMKDLFGICLGNSCICRTDRLKLC